MKGKGKATVSGVLAAAALAGIFSGSAHAATPMANGIGNVYAPSHVAAGVNASAVFNDEHAGKHDCKGKNECKGKGGCKGNGNCKGKNECKGKGGCASEEAHPAH